MNTRLRGLAFCLLGFSLLAGAGCNDGSPSGPRARDLSIVYLWEGEVLPSADPMCPHHNAPLDTYLTTSWGLAERMHRQDDGRWTLYAWNVDAGEHYLQLVDIRHCGVNSTPRVTEGFSVNGVALHRTGSVDGVPSVFFSLERDGRVLP